MLTVAPGTAAGMDAPPRTVQLAAEPAERAARARPGKRIELVAELGIPQQPIRCH